MPKTPHKRKRKQGSIGPAQLTGIKTRAGLNQWLDGVLTFMQEGSDIAEELRQLPLHAEGGEPKTGPESDPVLF